jgi:hypothetical protein
MANGLGQSKWYYFSVYYYLHFQYNGVFIFGLLSLFYRLIEEKGIPFDLQQAKRSGVLLFICLFPSYFLSTLFANPGLVFNFIGLVGAILQLLAVYNFIATIRKIRISFNQNAQVLMTISLIAFILKAILQLTSSHPTVARLALEVRAFTIAYLHLVLIGVVTFFLLAWYLEKRLLKTRASIGVGLLIIGFVGSELAMISSGIPQLSFPNTPILLFIFSAVIVLAVGFLTLQSIFLKHNVEASSNGKNI